MKLVLSSLVVDSQPYGLVQIGVEDVSGSSLDSVVGMVEDEEGYE